MNLKTNQRNGEFANSHVGIVSRLTQEFIGMFCDDGVINWKRLVQFNSGRDQAVRKRGSKKL